MISSTLLTDEVMKIIALPFGRVVTLVNRLAKQETLGPLECARNIYLVSAKGAIIWQVHSDFDREGHSFTNIMYENGELAAYRWDGGMYAISLEDGKATPTFLAK